MLYALGIEKRHSFSCGKVDTPGSAYFYHLEGSFPTGEGLWSPSRFSTCRRTRSRTRASYYARSTGDSARVLGRNMHFGSSLAICVC
jgi:hypothetical protein